jgi:NADPH2:quinone reductase
MKAIQYRGLGGYEVIEIGDRAVRAPGAGEVRINVKAAAVNPTDILLRDPGGYGNTLPPWTPGMDAAGIVESVGAGVAHVRAGDKVMAVVLPNRPEGGAQAAQVVVPAASVASIPNGVSFAQASTLPMNGLTALLGLELAGLKEGESLAVSGGAGYLARLVIGIARHRGLNVIADAKPSELERVRGYGASVVVPRGAGFCEAVRQAAPGGVDALFDTALLLEKSFPAIRDDGVYLPVRGWGDAPSERGIQIKPVFVSRAAERTEWLEQLRDLVSSGHLQLEVAAEYPPEQVADAQRSLAAGGLRGRPVIVF